jgi:CheY-like chemotaxis protein
MGGGETAASRTASAARVLVGEPHPEVRALLQRVLDRLGLEPVSLRPHWRGEALPDVDVLILEPALEHGVALAHDLRHENPDLPVICTSSDLPDAAVAELEPIAYLLKPFRLADLEGALLDAVAQAVARSGGASNGC